MTQKRTQEQRIDFLLRYLLNERGEYQNTGVPANLSDKRLLLRSLMNVRLPAPVSEEFLREQDRYLQTRLSERGITKVADLTPVQAGLYLWKGDITTLAADGIANSANSGMLGCFVPCHR